MEGKKKKTQKLILRKDKIYKPLDRLIKKKQDNRNH